MNPVDVVTPENIHRDVEGVLLDGRMARVQLIISTIPLCTGAILPEPIGMEVIGMGRLRWCRSLIAPDVVGHQPGMYLDSRRSVMGSLNQICERIESGGDIRRDGLQTIAVVGVSALTDLHEERIAVCRS